MSEPRTEAGRGLLETLNRFRWWSADPNVKQVLTDMDLCITAIEDEMAGEAVTVTARAIGEAAGSADPLENVLADLRAEVAKARAKHAPINSPHEGWAVIREELDPELWQHVCGDTGRSVAARHEALQIAAMGIRYILDLIDDPLASAVEEGGRR